MLLAGLLVVMSIALVLNAEVGTGLALLPLAALLLTLGGVILFVRGKSAERTTPEGERREVTPQNVGGLDILTLNASGWLLLLSTFGMVLVYAFAWAMLAPDLVQGDWGKLLVGGVGLLLARFWFFGGKAILSKLGYPILSVKPRP